MTGKKKKDDANPAVPLDRQIVGTELSALCQKSIDLVNYARSVAERQINLTQLLTFYALGRWIVEVQQDGASRAPYGSQVIKRLSEALTQAFGNGFSQDTLENARKFYLSYRDRIPESTFQKFAVEKSEPLVRISDDVPFKLSWTHYLILMRIQDPNERSFYEKEAIEGNWSKRELSRQYASSLYERLLLSSNKNAVLQATKGEPPPEDFSVRIKDPYILEFLGLHDQPEYTETDLESRIIDNLQAFLLEMGKGFTFVGRQVRFTFDEDHFRVDLVLYNRLLRCFVLIDLKTGKLKHQDLGQMQMYVNYYDRYQKTEEENPTIGILLCAEKNDSMVALTLPEDSNIYASKYELYLPDKNLLQKKLQEWIDDNADEGA